MTAISPEVVLEQLHLSAARAREIVARLEEEAVREPSALPQWSRGHVMAHLSQVCQAMDRQLEYAGRGEKIEIYDGGAEGRNNRIDLAAGHSAQVHRADFAAALESVLNAFDSLDAQGWSAPVSYRDGTVLEAGQALWRELVIHPIDLDLGYGPESWSKTFCLYLINFLQARVPQTHTFVLQPLGLPPISLGSGSDGVVINGMLSDIAAWLAGREPSLGSLRASAAADDVDLPALLPWPSALPARP